MLKSDSERLCRRRTNVRLINELENKLSSIEDRDQTDRVTILADHNLDLLPSLLIPSELYTKIIMIK